MSQKPAHKFKFSKRPPKQTITSFLAGRRSLAPTITNPRPPEKSPISPLTQDLTEESPICKKAKFTNAGLEDSKNWPDLTPVLLGKKKNLLQRIFGTDSPLRLETDPDIYIETEQLENSAMHVVSDREEEFILPSPPRTLTRTVMSSSHSVPSVRTGTKTQSSVQVIVGSVTGHGESVSENQSSRSPIVSENQSSRSPISSFSKSSNYVNLKLAPNYVDSESESENGDDIDLDKCLEKETEEERAQNLKLDLMDKAIEDGTKASVLQSKIFDSRMKSLKDSIQKKEMERSMNRSRANSLIKIGLDEIKSRAEMSLSHIAEIEDNNILTPRRKLYRGTAGEQQSLFFRQIWEPFTDDQYEVVFKVLNDWSKERGEEDDHYIKNVTLPELFLHIYKNIFNLSTIAESEECIFNTPV